MGENRWMRRGMIIASMLVASGCLGRVADVLTSPGTAVADVAQRGVRAGGADTAVADVDRLIAQRPDNAAELQQLREALLQRVGQDGGDPGARSGTYAQDPERRRDWDRRASEELAERDRWKGSRVAGDGDRMVIDGMHPGRDLRPDDRPATAGLPGSVGPIPWHLVSPVGQGP